LTIAEMTVITHSLHHLIELVYKDRQKISVTKIIVVGLFKEIIF